MQLGDLDRRIRIEQYTEVVDTWGQRTQVWSTLANVWANVLYESGEEKYEADQKVAVRLTKFIVRYSSAYNEKLRVVYNSEYYDIRSIEEIGRKDYQVLKALRKDNLT